jgi:hypothetical protein
MTDAQLREEYKCLIAAQRAGTFTGRDAVKFLAICIELTERGYRLTDDEQDWVKWKGKGRGSYGRW